MQAAWKDYQEKNKDRFLDEMLDLLRIPSVSAKSEHKEDMRRCAEAVRERLLQAGADKAEVMETAWPPGSVRRKNCGCFQTNRAGVWPLRCAARRAAGASGTRPLLNQR
jgi:acetylornithine deacetylase/succinyl-diaminopimelate desuccinylase-like protein